MNGVLPHNEDAENSLIGCVLFLNEAIDEVATRHDEFYIDANAVIWETVRDMWNRGCRAIDPITLAEELEQRGKLGDAGGAIHIHKCLETVPHAAHARHYATIVANAARQRRLIASCKETLSAAYNTTDGAALAAAHVQSVQRILETGATDDVVWLRDAVQQHLDLAQSSEQTIPTGLIDLDKQLDGGLKRSHLIVVGARPSCGKSVLGAQICRNVAERVGASLIVSLEMEAHEIAGRYVTHERSKREPAIEALQGLPVAIVDSVFDVNRIVAVIRRMARREDIHAVVIDYLQLMEPSDVTVGRERQVAGLSRQLKMLARELRIPVVLLCQLNRQCDAEKRSPRLSDLRESGAIEQDADDVLLLHRPDMIDPLDNPGVLQISVAKQRGGPRGVVRTVFVQEQLRIENAAHPDFNFEGM